VITHHLDGKSGRHLLPELRELIEDHVFKFGRIPKSFLDCDPVQMACDIALALAQCDIREVGGNNMGHTVGLIQDVIGGVTPGGNGLAWCMSMQQVIVAFIEDYLQKESPFPADLEVLSVYQLALKVPGLVSVTCEQGAVACARHGDTSNGHAMLVLQAGPGNIMTTFEGNTNLAGSRDGDGAYIKTRDKFRNGNLQTLGFVRIYPKEQSK